jgi:hypothetical protein
MVLYLSACSGSSTSVLRVEGCPRCAEGTRSGAIQVDDLDECSGLVASAVHQGVFYAHNDSGDRPRFFAVDGSGALRGELEVVGATAVDWEDVARGPCGEGGGSCLFLGDIGDNDRARRSYAIYRVNEPESLDGSRRAITAGVLSFSYPEGSQDAETLLVHPVTGAITVVTKVKEGRSRVFEISWPAAGEPAAVVPAGEIAPPTGSPRFTGGDVHPEGLGVLLRTSSDVLFYPMEQGQTVATALSGAPCVLPSADEEQGEAIAWLPGGWDYVTISEGSGAKIHRFACAAL